MVRPSNPKALLNLAYYSIGVHVLLLCLKLVDENANPVCFGFYLPATSKDITKANLIGHSLVWISCQQRDGNQ